MVYQYTEGRTKSLKEMSDQEFGRMMRELNGKSKPMPATETKPNPEQESMNTMRMKIFSLCRQMGYIYGFSEAEKNMNQAVVYALVERNGYLKPKKLNSYTAQELVKLVSQFEHWKKNNNKAEAAKVVAKLKEELGL